MFNNFSQNHQTATNIPLNVYEEKPAISVIGLGYVGAVSTACLAHLGHKVIGVDVNIERLTQIATGVSPIHEKDLNHYLSEAVEAGLLSTSDDIAYAVRESNITFVSVGTPTAADGGCDYSHLNTVARAIGTGLAQKNSYHTIVMRCSIPPGTTVNRFGALIEKISGLKAGEDFGLCFNPEFLREGVAIADFHTPPKTVIGTSDERVTNIMRQIYATIDPNPIITTIEVAEMVKYVDNVWHATKVCFANETGRICKALDIDSHKVMDIFVNDTKLNLSPYYLKPGFAYGGSCLPKEVRAVNHIAQKAGINVPLIENLDHSNQVQITEAVHMALKTGAHTIGVLGLAFKAGTDDLRESPVLDVIVALRKQGIKILAHDPVVTKSFQNSAQMAYVRYGASALNILSENLPDMMVENLDDITDKAEAIIVAHKTPAYKNAVSKSSAHIIDLVRLFSETPTEKQYSGICW